MTIMFYDSAESDQYVTSETWTEVVSKTGALRGGTQNYIFLYAEYGGSATNREVGLRALVDGTERGFDHHLPSLTNQPKAFSVFGMLQPSVDGDHTISLEARALGSPQTVLIRRIRLMVMQT